jgi:hypothetical protein
MNNVYEKSFAQVPGSLGTHGVTSLSQLWAKKYVQKLSQFETSVDGISTCQDRAGIVRNLMQELRSITAQAWAKTEVLLAQEVRRHQIDHRLINPWEIAKDTHFIYEKALNAYAAHMSPQQLSLLIAGDVGCIRHKYTIDDPRVIGFISMQVHYSGQQVLEIVPLRHQIALRHYFSVIDDYLYMPLQRAYAAAGNHDLQSPVLQTIQQLLPVSTEIARRVVTQILGLYPSYVCRTGLLSHPSVQISSIRDVEMFQTYLWVCLLEGNVEAIQQELFPLCVMLYPKLKVRWELIRHMLHLLGNEIDTYLQPEAASYYKPYYQLLWDMFSPTVFSS